MKIREVEFEVDTEWDRDGRIESMAVFLPGDIGDQDLIEVLSEKVLQEIEQELYKTYEGPNINKDDPREDR